MWNRVASQTLAAALIPPTAAAAGAAPRRRTRNGDSTMRTRTQRGALATAMLALFSLGIHARGATAQTTQPPASAPLSPPKRAPSFYPAALVARARANADRIPWAARTRDEIVAAAEPWMKMSDDELWRLMFGNTIKRAWQVLSDGHCPACRKPVPMYNWKMDALNHPWKTRCPHCQELFPKNDFEKFYKSGLDERNIFDPRRADRSLLFNADHPAPDDPLRGFGVDDGEGYAEGDRRWRFIGAYLIFGQWKQAVVSGIRNLGAAYVMTGRPAYAHKAAVLLDRVADLYPTFDFGREGVMYEGPPRAGYVSTWHDACEETREMVLAYDQIFDALAEDRSLAAFLADRSRRFKGIRPKETLADIRRNIEDRILRDALASRDKIYSNYPRTEIAVAVIDTVLGWPANREQVFAHLDGVLHKATAVDGVTGEKGLAGYAAYTIQGLAVLLEQYARMDSQFLPDLLKRHPRVRDMYRFHIDTWCMQTYYPTIGDTGSFAAPVRSYVGAPFSRTADLDGSMYSFFWRLYETTGDAAFAQVLYHANGNKTDELPFDVFADAPDAFQAAVRDAIARHGPEPQIGSVNKQQWHLAILRSGSGPDARAVWLDYDSGGGHGHADAMNIGLIAKGLDLLPDFGYPPVQYGGWGSPHAVWYTMTAAHNTVVVDGRNTRPTAGRTTLWADGERLRAVRASGPDLIGGARFERTVAMVDTSDRDCYILDVFRVGGGTDHVKFTASHFGQLTTEGLSLAPADPYGHGTQMRAFQSDPGARPGWTADWRIEDRHRLLAPGTDIHLRCTDLTRDAEAGTCEAWISPSGFTGDNDLWIPRIFTRRRAKQAPLSSTFVAILEPYERQSGIRSIRRLPLETTVGAPCDDSHVAVEIELADGQRDTLIASDALRLSTTAPTRNTAVIQRDHKIQLDGDLCLVRRDPQGRIVRVALACGRTLHADNLRLTLKKDDAFVEVSFADGKPRIATGEDAIDMTTSTLHSDNTRREPIRPRSE